jgi:hypothetical protein
MIDPFSASIIESNYVVVTKKGIVTGIVASMQKLKSHKLQIAF